MPFTDDDRNILIESHTMIKSASKILDDHEARIRKNENKRVLHDGVYMTLGGMWTAFMGLLWVWFKGEPH